MDSEKAARSEAGPPANRPERDVTALGAEAWVADGEVESLDLERRFMRGRGLNNGGEGGAGPSGDSVGSWIET